MNGRRASGESAWRQCFLFLRQVFDLGDGERRWQRLMKVEEVRAYLWALGKTQWKEGRAEGEGQREWLGRQPGGRVCWCLCWEPRQLIFGSPEEGE